MAVELIECVRKDLAELGVKDPVRFVPDGDQIAAAVIDFFMVRDEIKPPDSREVETWLVFSKKIEAGEAEIARFQSLYEQLYHDNIFRYEVLFKLGERSHAALREADARWEADVSKALDRDFQKLDLVKLFGPVESETAIVEPGAGMADLGAARKFIEQKYPLVTPGILTTFVFSAGAIIYAGRGSELDELMCERLLIASTPQILGESALVFGGLDKIMGKAGGLLGQKYLELSQEEIKLIQTAPLKPEHREILALMRSTVLVD